jgi:hypothetical protein
MSPRAFLAKLWEEGGPALFGFVMIVVVILGALITAMM